MSPLKGIRITGAILLLFTIILLWILPRKGEVSLPKGFHTPIVALELVQDNHELGMLFADAKIRNRFYKGNILDFAFIITYSLFLAFLILQFSARENLSKRLKSAALLFIAFTAFSDVMENLTLFSMSDQFAVQGFAGKDLFYKLHLWTLLKWESLGIVCLIISTALYSGKRKAAAFLFLIVFLMAVLGLISRIFVDYEGLVLGIAFIVAWIKSLPHSRAWW
ncbi:MAG: hypothetical protein D6767_07550 [Candidatus Hydrogenedentota bacterium]|nr:MAG: hypothetical protein D6767_07550 [Candidatus Hydrogenedentota bacterium]